MKDGDIYTWKWKHPSTKHFAQFSHIAIYNFEKLCDTYWSTDPYILDTEQIELAYKGNLFTDREIYPDEIKYYRAGDVIDLRHSNNSSAAVLVKQNAKRDPKIMLKAAKDTYKEMIRLAAVHVDKGAEILKEIEKIEDGNLDDVRF